MRLLCLVFVTGWFLTPKIFAEDAARAIVEKAIKAHGGPQNLAKLRVMRFKASGKILVPGSPDRPVVIERHWQTPDRYKSSIHYAALGKQTDLVRVLNGDQAWLQVDYNDRVRPMDKVSRTELEEQKYAEGLDRLEFLNEKGIKLSRLKRIEVQGQPAVGVLVKSKGHWDVKLYFDADTGLLVKRERIKTKGGFIEDAEFGDYRKVDGIPRYRTLTISQNGKKFMELNEVQFEFPDKFDPKVFAKPEV